MKHVTRGEVQADTLGYYKVTVRELKTAHNVNMKKMMALKLPYSHGTPYKAKCLLPPIMGNEWPAPHTRTPHLQLTTMLNIVACSLGLLYSGSCPTSCKYY